MSQSVEKAAAKFYEGFWGVLTRWFKVPSKPPSLPVYAGEKMDSFRPAPGFLRYLKFKFWVMLILIDTMIIVLWLGLTVAQPLTGLLLTPLVLAIAVLPDMVAYLAIHLRYDTTWYVMTERSLRIRRGIWIINEITITFENIQNVTIRQGPLQRYFGISNIKVHTAGGASGEDGPHGSHTGFSHQGLLEGLADARTIRDLILKRLQKSKSAGLGDEEEEQLSYASGWTPQQVAVMTEIRDLIRKMNG